VSLAYVHTGVFLEYDGVPVTFHAFDRHWEELLSFSKGTIILELWGNGGFV
jgi:hypothetical protein